MSTFDHDVLVAGAGPTGLTLASVLAQWGVGVRVVDAAAAPSRGSRAKGLQPRSLEMLDGLGLAGRLVALGRFRMPVRRYAGLDDRVGIVHETRAAPEPTPDRPFPRALVIPQWRVEEALRERLDTLGIVVEGGCAVTGLAQDGDGVTVVLADGTTARSRYAVGCDGGSSAVRRLLGVSFVGETHDDVRMLLADVVVDGLDRDHWHQFGVVREGRFAMLCPLPATETFQLQAAVPRGRPSAQPTRDVLQEVVDSVAAGVRLRDVAWSSRWRLNVRMVDRYRVGRAFLAGDAAHVHSPAGAQGMNTGIQDAANLGWKLAQVLAGADPALLDTYEGERMPVAADVLGLSTALGSRPFEDRGPEGDRTTQLDLTYRSGPLASDPGDGAGPRAGDRAPDAPCRTPGGAPVRLFDLFRADADGAGRPHWTALGFGVVPPRIEGPVRAVAVVAPGEPVPAGPAVVDAGGYARASYAAAPGELVLVRPDGYVATRGSAAAVVGWLHGVLPAVGARA